MKRYRVRFVPPIPVDIYDFNISGEWPTTWHDQQFLSHLDNDWGIAVFTTTSMLKALQKADCLYVDGTFRTAPPILMNNS